MEFSGEFELEGVSVEEAWLVLSDPIGIRKAAPGCKFITRVDDEFNFDTYEPEPRDVKTLPEADPEVVAERAFEEGEEYAVLMEIGVGSVKPTFETHVTIDEREYPTMEASGSGSSSGSAFTMNASMTLLETETGVRIDWYAETDISGRLAQMGQRLLNPVANKVVNEFFTNIEQQMLEVEEKEASDEGLANRVKDVFGN